jgi:hypothetical protein
MSGAASTIHDCRVIGLPRIVRPEGGLTPVEQGDLPFDIRRIYYLYDVPGGAGRGGHAHRQLEQLVVCVMGCFVVDLDDGAGRKSIRLERAYEGLYVPRMIWREMREFSSGGICLVLASAPYDESDYVRSYEEFKALRDASAGAGGGGPE